MKAVNHKESNLNMGAGDNPNTNALHVTVASREDMPNHIFYVSKWEPADEEIAAFKDKLVQIMKNIDIIDEKNLIDRISEILPSVYLASMNGQFPVIIQHGNPFDEGWMKPMDAIAKAMSKENKPIVVDTNGDSNEGVGR